MTTDSPRPIFVPPHAGKRLDFLAVTHKQTSQQTGGGYYLFESVFEPGTGIGLHVHRREDEVGYVLEGARNDGTLDDALYRKLSLDYGIEWLE